MSSTMDHTSNYYNPSCIMTSKALLIAWLSPLKVGSLSFHNYLDVLYEWLGLGDLHIILPFLSFLTLLVSQFDYL